MNGAEPRHHSRVVGMSLLGMSLRRMAARRHRRVPTTSPLIEAHVAAARKLAQHADEGVLAGNREREAIAHAARRIAAARALALHLASHLAVQAW